MPTYTFFNELSGTEYDEFMSISDMEKMMKENSHIKRVWNPDRAPALVGDHLMGVGPKNDEGFKERMGQIAAAHPTSPMADKYGSGKSNAQIKAREIVKKHKVI